MKKGFNLKKSQLIKILVDNTPIIILMGVVIVMRLLPHPPNFTPVIALGLFGVTIIQNRYLAFSLPLFIMFLSDIFIGFHSFMPFVYFSIFISSMVGIWLQRNFSEVNIIVGSFISATSFFLITNTAVWLTSTMYPKTITGLLTCLNVAIPFYHNTIFSTMLYSAVLFLCVSALRKFKFIGQES